MNPAFVKTSAFAKASADKSAGKQELGIRNQKLGISYFLVPIFYFLIMSLVIMPCAHAMESGSYKIPSLTISSGGSNNLQSGSYKMIDIKGQGVIGYGESGSYGLGLGGIYGEVGVGEGEIPEGPIGDTGLIRQTRIVRIGDQIWLYWAYKPGSGITSADIWELRGTDQEFNDSTEPWVKIVTGVSGTDSDTGRTSGDNRHAYYRIVPTGTTKSSIMGMTLNTRVAAKIDVLSVGGGIANYLLKALPLYGVNLGETFAGQANANMMVWDQAGGGVKANEWDYAEQKFPLGDITMAPGIGYWIQNNGEDVIITYVGTLETSAFRNIATKDLTGNPLPITVSGTTVGGNVGDKFWVQVGGGVGAIEKRLEPEGWGDDLELGLGQGFWYWHDGERYFDTRLFGAPGEKVRIMEGAAP